MKITQAVAAATAQLVERQVSDRKVADFWFDSRSHNASLCLLRKAYHSSWLNLTKDLQTEAKK